MRKTQSIHTYSTHPSWNQVRKGKDSEREPRMFNFLRPRKRARTNDERPSAKEVIACAKEVNDPFDKFDLPTKLQTNSKDELMLRWSTGGQLESKDMEWMVNSVESNLKKMYEQSRMKWNRREKVNEMKHKDQRIIIAEDEGVQEQTAFLTFRWDLEEGRAVMYVYELFVNEKGRGKGIGQAMMRLAEMICRAHKVPEIMLTVFSYNSAAMKLYLEKLE